MTSTQPASGRATPWPRYEAAAGGLPEYWYPVGFSRALGRRPLALRLLDQPVMLLRDGEKAYALYDQCPHRGVPLSLGQQEFPCTWTCRYHGWTFDVETGVLKAAITDGPDSPICGKVRVKTYPVEERFGVIWIYMGDGQPPPLEEDIPSEFLAPNTIILGRIVNNRIGLDVRTETAGAWNTSVRYYGGHFALGSSVHTDKDRFGVRLSAAPGAYVAHNRHLFDGPGFELQAKDRPITGIPFLIEVNSRSVWARAVRMEGCSPHVARHTAGAQDHVYEVAWASQGYLVDIDYPASATRTGSVCN